MKVEELLKPRYKLVADYPGNSRPIGFVFIMNKYDSEGWYTTTGYLQEKFFTQYPHLFQRLDWWESRDVTELPMFIRNKEGRVYSLSGWKKDMLGRYYPMNFVDKEKETEMSANIDWFFNANHFLPATEQEYIEYTQKEIATT